MREVSVPCSLSLQSDIKQTLEKVLTFSSLLLTLKLTHRKCSKLNVSISHLVVVFPVKCHTFFTRSFTLDGMMKDHCSLKTAQIIKGRSSFKDECFKFALNVIGHLFFLSVWDGQKNLFGLWGLFFLNFILMKAFSPASYLSDDLGRGYNTDRRCFLKYPAVKFHIYHHRLCFTHTHTNGTKLTMLQSAVTLHATISWGWYLVHSVRYEPRLCFFLLCSG